jgi:alpha-beta hydrolase superfamily lysophospholipase
MPAAVQWLVGLAGLALGCVGCVEMVVVEWAAWVLVLPGRRPGAIGEKSEGIEGEPIVAVAADGVRLAGVWHVAGAGREGAARGTVVVLHGFAEEPSVLRARTAALNQRGWNVAAVDTRAHGRSGGDRGSFGGREGADVRAWIDALGDSGRVAVWGRSMGAAIAARAAADDPRIAAVVLEAPYLDLTVTLATILRRKHLPCPRILARLILHRAGALAGVSLARPRPIDVVGRIACPALVVHGTDDRLIPSDDARRLARAFPRPATFIEVAGAGHADVVEVGGAALLDQIGSFLDETIPVSPSASVGTRNAIPG